MTDFVPDFQIEEDDSIPTSSGFNHHNKPSMPDEELMELIWQNGQVVINSQPQRSLKKSNQQRESGVRNTQSSATATADEQPYQHLFMQEDEMASWLHYSLEEDFNDLIYPAPSCSKVTQLQPDPAPSSRLLPISPESNKLHHFMRCSRPNARDESQQSVKEVESSHTPRVLPNGSQTQDESGRTGEQEREMGTTYDLTMTSSSGGSGGSADPIPSPKPAKDDRKRKARELDEQEDEDAKFEAADTKKQGRGSSSARRSRAAEVHNLSERRRRDRINEKMKALQELIPRCNKSDKASMLDEAIEYLKSLQLQVQMMSMGCSMVPMMYPGVQSYMSPMGMGMGMGMRMGMGMGMGMDMGLNRPMMPYPQVLAAPSMPRPAAAAQMGPRLPMPAYQLPSGSSPDAPAMHPNQIDPSLNSIGIRSPNPAQVSYADSYHRYHNHYSMQAPPHAPDQVLNTAQASTSKGVERLENQKPG